MAEDYSKRLKDVKPRFAGLQNRMDGDKGWYWGKIYKMLDKDGREIPNVLSLSMNDAQIFADRVIDTLVAARMQRVYESMEGQTLKDEDSSALEHYDEQIYQWVDERLATSTEIDSLDTFVSEQLSIRGWVGARCLLNAKGSEVLPDVLPIDSRFLYWKKDVNGLDWVAWEGDWTREEFEAKYNQDLGVDTVTLATMLDREYEAILREGKVLVEQSHSIGYVPFIIAKASRGSFLQEKDGFEHTGESIYSSARDLFEPWNEVVSILRNLTYSGFFAGVQIELEPGAPTPQVAPWGQRFVAGTPKGSQYRLMPFQDVKNATRLLYSILESRLQRATLPATDFGNLQFPLSAVAIARLGEARDSVYIPRLQGKGHFYRGLSDMFRRQHADGGVKAELEGVWHKVDIDSSLLKRQDIKVSFQFFTNSPEQNIANYSVAAAAGDLISDKMKRRDILQIESPDQVEQEIWAEKAERLVPELALYNMAKALMEQDRDAEAKLIAMKIGLTLEQIKSGRLEAEPMQEETRKPVQPQVPLMGGGKSTSPSTSAKQASQMETQLEAEE